MSDLQNENGRNGKGHPLLKHRVPAPPLALDDEFGDGDGDLDCFPDDDLEHECNYEDLEHEFDYDAESDADGDDERKPRGRIGTVGQSPVDMADVRVGQPLTPEQQQAVKDELEAAAASKRAREEEAKRLAVDADQQDDGDWDDWGDSDERYVYRSPKERAVHEMLEQVDREGDDQERLRQCCLIAVHEIDPNCDYYDEDDNIDDESDYDADLDCMHAAIRDYEKQRPFSRTVESDAIYQGIRSARRQIKLSIAATAVNMVGPQKLMRIAEWDSDLIQGVIPAGTIGIISGAKNTLKTTIGLDLQISLASGKPFLGHWPVARSICTAMIVGEDSRADAVDAIKRICAAKGIDRNTLSGCFYISVATPNLHDESWLTRMRRFIDLAHIESLGIEGSYLGLGGVDQRSLQAMGDALVPIKRLCDDTGCATRLALHHKRAAGSSWPGLDDIAGVGFSEVSRSFLLINSRGRWNPDTGEHWLRLVISTKQGEERYHLDVREGKVDDVGGRVWAPTISKPGDAPATDEQPKPLQSSRPAGVEAYKQRVLAVLAKHPAGLSKTAMCSESRVPENRKTDVITALLDSKQIEECEISVSNQITPRLGYKICQPAAADSE
jgi:hypothetical protein